MIAFDQGWIAPATMIVSPANCFQFIEAHGGRIWATANTAQGKTAQGNTAQGATFQITLPRQGAP